MTGYLPVILGSDENAYGTARLFHELGARPLLLCARALNATRDSRLFDLEAIPDFDRGEVFPDALARALEQRAERYPEGFVVVPCSDYYTGLITRHYPRFAPLVRNRFNPPELLETFDTKDKFYALCEKYGLDYPKTAVCAPDERESVLQRLPFEFPIVVKPENSNAVDYLHCHFEGQKKVFFFDTREEYLAMLVNMEKSGYRGKLILQEFVPGGDGAMRVLNSYSDNDARVRAMCLGQPVLEYYEPSSIGNYAAVFSRGDRALYERMQAFLEGIGYVGFSNFDIKYDRRTGRYLLFEINPRLGRSSYFVRAAGINMMKLLADDAVYGKRAPCVYNEVSALWSNVPRGILKRYVSDPALGAEIERSPMVRTLSDPADFNLKRLYRAARVDHAQYKMYRKYYFDKEKER